MKKATVIDFGGSLFHINVVQKAPSAPAEIYKLLVDAVTDYSIFALDPTGHVLTWNTGAEILKGYSADEIIGKYFSIFYPEKERNTGHPEEELRLALKNGRYEEEGWRQRKDGTLFWANVILTPLRDTKGRHLGFTKVTRDLTERRAAEDRRLQEEQRFRFLVEGVKDYAILMLDKEGRVSSWNEGARRFKGYEASEILGKHFSQFYPEADIKAKKPEMELDIASRSGQFEDEGWRVKKDGSLFWANVLITAVRNKAGELVGFSKVTRDLTERKRNEEELRAAYEGLEIRVSEKTKQLEEALHARDEFLSIASHELKTPITGIKMQIQLTKMRLEAAGKNPLDVPKMLRSLQVSEGQLTRLTQLIENLLDISRIQAGKMSYNFEKLNFNAIFQELMEGFSQLLTASKTEFTSYIDEELEGYWDRLRLEQVFINLISNALKYAPGSRIVVFAKREDNDEAYITVQDFGPGIPEKERAKIFERFERLGQTRNMGGLGLGLYISKQIVNAHGGTIEMKPGKDSGSTFIIRLPLDSRAGKPVTATLAQALRGTSPGDPI